MSDLISRQAVADLVDELARAISDERCCISRGRSTASIMQDILDLPSVQPKPKTEPTLDKLDEIITKQIDISDNQVECQTLRWVLDVMSEMNVETTLEKTDDDCVSRADALKCFTWTNTKDDVFYAIKALPSVQPINQNIKALGEELRTFRGGIKDKKVLTGFNMAIALCNKHLADMRESEDEE